MINKILSLIIMIICLSSCDGMSKEDPSLTYVLPNLRIETLSIEGQELDFEANKTGTYELNVDSSISSIKVFFTLNEDAKKGNTSYVHIADGIFEFEDINGLSEIEIDLQTGKNLLSISISDETNQSYLTYQILIYKLYSSAQLDGLFLYELPSDSNDISPLSPNFSPDIYQYSIAVPYTSCAVAVLPITQAGSASITQETNRSSSEEPIYKNLEVGRNYLDLLVSSEDGLQEKQYSIEIMREAGDSSANTNLKSLSISATNIEFLCGIYSYTSQINSNVSKIELKATTEAEGAKLWVNGQSIAPNESVEIAINNDISLLQIDVISTNGQNIQTYEIELQRRVDNLVSVETVEQLAFAVKNARPNDYIELDHGDYDLNKLEDFELNNGSLFSDRSGSALEPIILTGKAGDEVNIYGSGQESSSIFSFSGKHWKIGNLNLKNSDYGLTLIGAQNLVFSNINFSDLKYGAIEEKAGKNNIISLNRFEKIGDPLKPEEKISTIIDISDQSNGFEIRQNTFILKTNNIAVRQTNDSIGSIIESNTISHAAALTELTAPTLSLAGDESHVRYNNFDIAIKTYEKEVIETLDNGMSDNIGIFIYDNFIKDTGNNIPFINAGFNPSYLHLNKEKPEELTIEGAGLVENWQPPLYKIRIKDNSNYCLGLYQQNINDTDINFAALDLCNENNEQLWKIEADDTAPYVKIENTSITDTKSYLTTSWNYYDYCSTTLFSANLFLDEDNHSFLQRWLLVKEDDSIRIQSQSNSNYSLSFFGAGYEADDLVSLCPRRYNKYETFELIPAL